MKIYSAAVLFLLIVFNAISQNCKVDNVLVIDKTNINETFIASKIKELKKVFNPEEIKLLEKQIIDCNNNIDNSIARLKTTVMSFSLDKQELLKLKDLKKIQEQLEEKQKSREKIKEQIQSDLTTINYKGLYLCALKNLDPMSHSPAELADLSKSLIAQPSIEFINGVFIFSVSELYKTDKNESFTSYIKTVISGEMGVDKVALSKRTNGQTQFIYIARIGVSPLKKTVKTKEMQYGDTKNNFIVLNLLEENTYKDKLKSFGVSFGDITEIENQLNTYREAIKEENELARKQQNNILSSGNTNLDKIDSEISMLQAQLSNNSSKVKELIENKTNLKYSKDKHEACINDALKFIDNKIKDTYNQIVDFKEQELIGMYNRNVSNEGSPADDIAKTALNLYDQIKKSYSKLEQFLKIQELLNGEFINNQLGHEKIVYREIEKIWIYPVPGDDNNYRLSIVAKFKILNNNTAQSDNVSKVNLSDKNTVIKDDNKKNQPSNIDKDSFIDERDGKIYKKVTIGTQTWMAENLNYAKPGNYWCYDGDNNNCNKFGKLYDWETAKIICPEGWHLPSNDEWTILLNYLNPKPTIKLVSNNYWKEKANSESAGKSGFNALPSGYRDAKGKYKDLLLSCGWWCSKEEVIYKDVVMGVCLKMLDSDITMWSNSPKKSGFSVRCVKDK